MHLYGLVEFTEMIYSTEKSFSFVGVMVWKFQRSRLYAFVD